jgi:hypothetical protein
MTQQTKAQRLADQLDADATIGDMGRKPNPKCHKRKAAAELRWLEHNNQVLMNALMKACGDDEEMVKEIIESQGELK